MNIVADDKITEIQETRYYDKDNNTDDKLNEETSLFFDSFSCNHGFIQRFIDLALPIIRIPSKKGLIDNLPDWNLSDNAIYDLNWYMSSALDHVDVHVIPENSRITYDSKIKRFQFSGPPDAPFQSIIYLDVFTKTETDSSILIAYTTPDKSDTDTENILGLMHSREIFVDATDSEMSQESPVNIHEIAQSNKSAKGI